jgi:hypothetical protein
MSTPIDPTSPHYKGRFNNIYDANLAYPNGGAEGDFIDIDGWAHYWNADRGTWGVNKERDAYWDELLTTHDSYITPHLEFDNTGDGFLEYGETCDVTCHVVKGFDDITDSVTSWEITRDSGDPVEDDAWNQSAKAKNFNGKITFSFTPTQNDLGTNANSYITTFNVTAHGQDGTDVTKTISL